MRVLFAVTAHSYGGAPRHVAQLMRRLSQRGWDLGVVCGPAAGLLEAARDAGATVFENRHFVQQPSPWRDARATVSVVRAVRRFSPDVLHGHSTKAGLAARLAGVTSSPGAVVFTAHGWGFAGEDPGAARRAVGLLEKGAARVTDRIICVSEHDRGLALDRGIADEACLRVVHNGVDVESFRAGARPGAREALGIDEQAPVVLSVGRLVPQKDPFVLLDAIERVPEAQLVFVGAGPLEDQLRARAHEAGLAGRVHLPGYLGEGDPSVASVMAQADVFALSSRWEGLPYTVIEAMAMGLPTVATDVGGLSELVVEGETGYLVPPGDPRALGERLRALMENPGDRQEMGQTARARAERAFSEERMVEQTVKVYEEALAATRS